MGLCETAWGVREAMEKQQLGQVGGAIEGFKARTEVSQQNKDRELAREAQLG
jgi:hypothetical protein